MAAYPQESFDQAQEDELYTDSIDELLKEPHFQECVTLSKKALFTTGPERFVHERKTEIVSKIVHMLIQILQSQKYWVDNKGIFDIVGQLLEIDAWDVHNYLEFLNLPKDVRDMYQKGRIEYSDAMMIRGVQIDQKNNERTLAEAGSEAKAELEEKIEELFQKIQRNELYDHKTKTYTVDVLSECIRKRGVFIISFLLSSLQDNLNTGRNSLDSVASAINDATGIYTRIPFETGDDVSLLRILDRLRSYRTLKIHPVESTRSGRRNPRREK